jgi:Protein of unknown function, DUF547
MLSIRNKRANLFTVGLMVLLGVSTPSAAFYAHIEDAVLKQFRGDTRLSKLTINYDDYSTILQQTVLHAGQSDRVSVKKAAPTAGSRIQRGSSKSTRLEGNRLDFHAFMGENGAIMVALRDDIANVPTILPLSDLNRNEQLAYWLNLYNITLITQINEVFPESNMRKFFQPKRKTYLLDQKVLTVAGVQLSLNDIQFKILLPKYHNPLVIYGMFQGVIGSPNIMRTAFTGEKVWKQLEQNATEFINSNRGAEVRYKKLRVSSFYKTNAALFPDFNTDLRKHLRWYAKPKFRAKIEETSGKIKTTQSNWYVADLYGGSKSIGAAVSTNGAAMLGAIQTPGGAGGSGGNQGGAVAAEWIAMMGSLNMNGTRFPMHVVEYLHKKEIRDRKTREGTITIEEQDRVRVIKPKAAKSEKAKPEKPEKAEKAEDPTDEADDKAEKEKPAH